MSKDDEDGLSKHTLNLFPGDYEKLRLYYPDTGAAAIVRRLVRRYIEKVEAAGGSLDVTVDINL